MATTPELSYSSMKTLQSCEQLYFYEKVAKLAPDKDYDDGDAMGLGKAFHQVMEKTLHKKYVKELLMEAMEEFEVEITDYPILEAMLKKYVKLHRLSGLEVVHCELRINVAGIFLGFIDMIMAAPDGTWWLGDLKTTGRFDESLLPRLPKDMQMNLYSKFVESIASQFNLDLSKFRGCRYRAITKPKLVQKAKESTEDYIKRLEENVQVYDIEIPFAGMDIASCWDLFMEAHERAVQLFAGEAPKKNYNSCIQYFRPCKHFSKCHGHLFSEGSGAVRVHTIQSFEDGDLL